MLLLSIPPLSRPWQSLVCFLSLCICPFYIFHIKEIIKCDLLCLISLAQCFWSSSMCSKYQCFILFHGLIVFHCMDILKFANWFIWWTFGLFPSFGDCELWIYRWSFVYKFLSEYLFSVLYLGAGLYGNSMLNFLRPQQTFFHGPCTTVYAHQQWELLFLQIFANTFFFN